MTWLYRNHQRLGHTTRERLSTRRSPHYLTLNQPTTHQPKINIDNCRRSITSAPDRDHMIQPLVGMAPMSAPAGSSTSHTGSGTRIHAARHKQMCAQVDTHTPPHTNALAPGSTNSKSVSNNRTVLPPIGNSDALAAVRTTQRGRSSRDMIGKKRRVTSMDGSGCFRNLVT